MNEIFKLFGTVEVKTDKAKKELDGIAKKASETGKKLQGIGESMSKVGSNMTRWITAPAIGAVAGVVKSFADLEQAVGGIETMFKGSADKVIKNSETAFKRAGVSGVDYMENVTSFSASLLQGLGGDTEKAAVLADTAMVDMADNANKFGTNIESIQDAYQGFAKENYTMLDNLKLGYGGTASEMARLINDSGVLGDTMEVTAENLNEVSFATMIEAIHEIQDEMGVTGTTALEAEETVSGSFGMMKASIMDLAAGFGQEGANIEELLGNVVYSAKTFAENIARVLGDIWDNLPLAPWQKWLGAIIIAGGPLLLFFGKIITGVGVMATAFGQTGTVIGAFTELFPNLSAGLSLMATPTFAVIAGIVALGAALVIAYKKSERFRNFVNGIGEKLGEAWGKVVEFKDNVVTAFKAIFAIFKGDAVAGVNILRSLGLSDETIEKIARFTMMVRIRFERLKDKLSEVFQNIKDFFVEAFDAIGQWWDANGETILGYVATGFEWLKTTIGLVMDLIKATWNATWDIIAATTKFIWPIITGTVTTAINVIVGLFKFFAPIVTGIWNVMWPAIQKTIEVVWNVIKIVIQASMKLIQTIIKTITALINKDWSTAWDGIKKIVSTAKDAIVKIITLMKDTLVNIIKALVNAVVNFFTDLWKKVTTKVTDIKNNVVNTFTDMKKNVSNRVNELKNDTINRFKDIYNGIKTWMTNAKNSAIDLAVQMKKNVIDKAKDILNYFTKLPGRLGNALTNGRNAFKAGFAKMLNAGISAVENGVNKIIDGINWVLEKLGAKGLSNWNAPKVSVPKYAKGTSGHEGGPAIVGDGGQKELISYPDGNYAMSPDTDTLVNLPKGTQVLSGPKTKRLMTNLGIPKYKDGIGSKIKEKAGDFWQWVTEGASSLLDKGLNFMGVKKPGKDDGPGVFSSMAGGAFTKIKDAAVGFIQNQMDSLFSFGGVNFPGFTLTSRFGQRWGRMHEGLDYAAPMGTPIPSQTGGKVTQSRYHPTYGNFVEVTSGGVQYRYAHNSKNLVAVGDAVGAGQILGLVGSTGRSTGPHVHFEIRTGGRAVDPLTFSGAGGGGFSGSSGMNQWTAVASQALRMTGQYSPDNLSRLLMQMKTESGGNARAINNWDSNARRGTPSKGLMQVIDPTFNAYKMPGYNNIWNPLDNILASIRYSISRYGSLTRAWRGVGYATGGLVGHGFYELGEEGYPEWIIPTDPKRRKDALKLLRMAGKGLLGNKRPDELQEQLGGAGSIMPGGYSYSDSQAGGGSNIESKLDQNNRLVQQLIDLLSGGSDINIDGATVGKVLFPHIDHNMNKQVKRNGAMGFN